MKLPGSPDTWLNPTIRGLRRRIITVEVCLTSTRRPPQRTEIAAWARELGILYAVLTRVCRQAHQEPEL